MEREPIPVALMRALLWTVLAIHFGMTLAYLTPYNPIKVRILSTVQGYMHPLFEQSWQLFAPDPVMDTRVLMVSCRLRQADRRRVETSWADITTPYWEAHYRNRLGPADRVARAHTNAARLVYRVDPLALKLRQRRPEDDPGYDTLRAALREAEDRDRGMGVEVLNRAASAHCDALHGPDRTEAVRVRLTVLTFPRFSRRRSPDADGTLHHTDFDWAPYQPVAPLVTGPEAR